MPLIEKIGEIEIYEIDKDLSKYTRKQRVEILNKMFMNEYQGKEISYLLNGKEIKAVINSTTRKQFFARQHAGISTERDKERKLRFDLIYDSGFDTAINSAFYVKTNNEQKVSQNSKHKIDTKWHTYIKNIKINNNLYILIISIREQKKRFYIHNVKLKEKRGRRSNNQLEWYLAIN